MGWIVSRKYRFIFIHIPKTGGTSIAEPDFQSGKGALVAQLGSDDYVQAGHVRAVGLKERLSDDWDSYFKFAFVRNPWDRLVSLYHYFLQDPEKRDSALGKAIAEFSDFPDFCRHMDSIELDAHFDPQVSYLIDYDSRFLVDFVGKFESIQKDLDTVCEKTGLSPVKLPHYRKSRHDAYQTYYNGESIEIIARKYASDIKAFSYSF